MQTTVTEIIETVDIVAPTPSARASEALSSIASSMTSATGQTTPTSSALGAVNTIAANAQPAANKPIPDWAIAVIVVVIVCVGFGVLAYKKNWFGFRTWVKKMLWKRAVMQAFSQHVSTEMARLEEV